MMTTRAVPAAELRIGDLVLRIPGMPDGSRFTDCRALRR